MKGLGSVRYSMLMRIVRLLFWGWALLLGVGASGAFAQTFYQCEEWEAAEADVRVLAAESARKADLWVYFVYTPREVAGTRPGVVYQTANRKEADFTLTFVESAKQADFSLWIVDDSTKAGWRNKGKEHLLDKYLKK